MCYPCCLPGVSQGREALGGGDHNQGGDDVPCTGEQVGVGDADLGE